MLASLALTVALTLAPRSDGGGLASCRPRTEARLSLPVEFGTGAALGAGSPVPWWASARVRPSVTVGRARIGAVAGRAGVGGHGSWTAGARLGWQLVQAPLDLVGVEVAAEAEGGVTGRVPAAAAVTLDLGSVVTMSARGVPKLGGHFGFFEVGVGLHPVTIVQHFTRGPAQAPPLPQLSDTLLIQTITLRVVLAAVYAERVSGGQREVHVSCSLTRLFAGLVAAASRESWPDVPALEGGMRAGGLGWFVDGVSGSDGIFARAKQQYTFRAGRPWPLDQAGMVREFIAGVEQALTAIYESRLPDI